MLLALRRPLLHQLLGVHLGPVHLRTGKSPAGTFDVDGPLDDFQPGAGVHMPPHQAEVAVGKGVARPHPDYKSPSWPVRPPCAARPVASAGRS